MDLAAALRDQFNGYVELHEKRPGIARLIAPLFHEDGDMLDIFLESSPAAANKVRICDHGMTLMRLSYSFELDTPNKERILDRILSENRILNEDGNLIIESEVSDLYSTIMQFAQTIAKVSNMKAFRREALSTLFEEMIGEFVTSDLGVYRPKPGFYPIPDRDELEVDYFFPLGRHPVYMFEIGNVDKARLAVIACLEFIRAKLEFKSFMVHRDFNSIPRKDRLRITSVADKQFTSVTDFRENAPRVFALEDAA